MIHIILLCETVIELPSPINANIGKALWLEACELQIESEVIVDASILSRVINTIGNGNEDGSVDHRLVS